MTHELQTLANLVKIYLEDTAPILSGNLLAEIVSAELVNVSDNEITFCIKAPFYDMKLWKQKGIIVNTGKIIRDKSDYAEWLNEVGAFGTHNKSMHWVNRALNDACLLMPNAEIINDLEL